VKAIPRWRAGSFLLGLFLIWLAVGSPLAAFDEELLTVHMVQHLLLMTVASFDLAIPVMPLLRFAPEFLNHSRSIVSVACDARMDARPAFCWLAAVARCSDGVRRPSAGLQSEAWRLSTPVSGSGSFLVARCATVAECCEMAALVDAGLPFARYSAV
jgi:hypothetical protein